MNRWRRWALAALLSLCCLLSACTWPVWPEDSPSSGQTTAAQPVSVPDGAAPPAAVQIPPYTGDLWTELQGNQPGFTAAQYTTDSYEYYSPLDKLGRCGYTMACIGRDLMPTEKRGEIGMIRPSGWHTVRYDFLKDKYLYNRCHLIAYQLAGENDNVCNLITGTRYFNAEGMLSFEEQWAITCGAPVITCCTGLRRSLRATTWLPPGWRWKPGRSRTKEKAFVFTCSCITCSPV